MFRHQDTAHRIRQPVTQPGSDVASEQVCAEPTTSADAPGSIPGQGLLLGFGRFAERKGSLF